MEGVSGAGGGGADKESRLPEELWAGEAAKITRSFGDGALKRADK